MSSDSPVTGQMSSFPVRLPVKAEEATFQYEIFPGRGEDSGRIRKRERSPCEEEDSSSAIQQHPQKSKKENRTLRQEEMAAFFRILDDIYIRLFLILDNYMTISDKYLLAMVLVYFRRAGLRIDEYRKNFFPALFLANQMEEEVSFRHAIYRWALGYNWMQKKEELHHERNLLLVRIGFRAWVDRDTCEQIMAEDPQHWAWRRERPIQHSHPFPMFRIKFPQLRPMEQSSTL